MMWSSPEVPWRSGVFTGQGDGGGETVLTGGGGATADSGEERRLGVGGTTPVASPSPSASLGRSRGGGGMAKAVDNEVVTAADGCMVWGFSSRRL
jgi:hypothetical protein